MQILSYIKTHIKKFLIITLVILALFPIDVVCGGRGACAMPPEAPNESARYNVSVQPLIGTIFSAIFNIDLGIEYGSKIKIVYNNK